MFFGVNDTNINAWKGAKAADEPFYFCDNSYFDESRQQYFRVTRNALQHSGAGSSDGSRFRALGVEIRPWRVSGEHVVICPHSEHFMRRIALYDGDWTADAKAALRERTGRELRVRNWSPDKGKLAASLQDDLANAHALVTWSSAAAVTAVLAGVPVVCMGPCAVAPMGGRIEDIEALPTPEREKWAGVLADAQWTLAEMRSGDAWEALQ